MTRYAPKQPLDPPADEVYPPFGGVMEQDAAWMEVARRYAANSAYWAARCERAEADADRLALLVYPGASNALAAHAEAVALR